LFWSNLGHPFHYKRNPILSFDHTSHFYPKTLSQISLKFCLSLSRSVQQKKGRRRSEEAARKLSFSWVISLVLFLSFSPSLFSLSVTCSKEEEDTKGRRKKKKEKKKEKRKKNKRRKMIFSFK
jgi:hypothetical protein